MSVPAASFEGATKIVTFEVRDPNPSPAPPGFDPDDESTWPLKNPSGAVVIKYGRVGGTLTTRTLGTDPEVEHPSTGTYRIEIPCPTDGAWGARIETGGDLVGAHDVYWYIEDSRLID